MSIPARVTLNCPDWCTADHRHGPDVDEYSDLVTHSREVGRVATVNNTVVVSVVATDVYERDGAGRMAPIRRSTPTVYVFGAEEMTPAQTEELIALLTEASIVAHRLAQSTTNPVIATAVRALRRADADMSRETAEKLLPMWEHFGELSQREVAAVLAEFTPDGRR